MKHFVLPRTTDNAICHGDNAGCISFHNCTTLMTKSIVGAQYFAITFSSIYNDLNLKTTLVNIYVALPVFTCIVGTS